MTATILTCVFLFLAGYSIVLQVEVYKSARERESMMIDMRFLRTENRDTWRECNEAIWNEAEALKKLTKAAGDIERMSSEVVEQKKLSTRLAQDYNQQADRADQLDNQVQSLRSLCTLWKSVFDLIMEKSWAHSAERVEMEVFRSSIADNLATSRPKPWKHLLAELLAQFPRKTEAHGGDKLMSILPLSCCRVAFESEDKGVGLVFGNRDEVENAIAQLEKLASNWREPKEQEQSA